MVVCIITHWEMYHDLQLSKENGIRVKRKRATLVKRIVSRRIWGGIVGDQECTHTCPRMPEYLIYKNSHLVKEVLGLLRMNDEVRGCFPRGKRITHHHINLISSSYVIMASQHKRMSAPTKENRAESSSLNATKLYRIRVQA